MAPRAAPDRPGGVHRPDKSEHFAERRFRTIRVLLLNNEMVATDIFPTGLAPGRTRTATPLAKTLLFPALRPLRSMEPKFPAHVYVGQPKEENTMGKGLLLWLIGIPIPIILLIWLFGGLH